MPRTSFILACLFALTANVFAQERKNFTIDDVITGFREQRLFYFEVLLENEKYLKAFNKCLKSKPADFAWMKQNCQKNAEFTNAFQCRQETFLHVWFVYETEKLCEEVRRPMKDKMDAIK